jgi:hypothetical protein
MKKVEGLETEDFIRSAEFSPDVRIDHSTVVKLDPVPATGSVLLSFSVGKQRIQVTVEAAMEHPFFVFDQGWSSSAPSLTQSRYQLNCQQLKVGDVCISLTHKLAPTRTTTSSDTPSKQVVFHDTPSIIRINTESPPLSRVDTSQDQDQDTPDTTKSSSGTSSPTSNTRNVSVKVSVTTSPVTTSAQSSTSTDSLDLKRRWSGNGENLSNKPKTVKTCDD